MSLVRNAIRANFEYAYASSTVSLPPVSTPTPFASLAAARPVAATRSASVHVESRSSPVAVSRTIGRRMRSPIVA